MNKKCAAGLMSAVMLFSMNACGGGQISADTENMKPVSDIIYPKAVDFEDHDTRLEVREQNPVDDKFLSDLRHFSYETSSAVLRGATGNVNYSPLSLYYALALACTGATGDTRDQIRHLLGVSDMEELSEQSGNLYRRLYTDHKLSQLKIADSIWLDSDTEFNGGFVKNAAENFYASTHMVDFTDEATGKRMGKWISDNTNGSLNPKINTDASQVLSILNTVYFNDEWTGRFDKDKTTQGIFHASGSDMTVEYMNKTLVAGFNKGNGFTRSSLGLKGTGEMIFILPDKGITVSELLASPKSVREIFEGGDSGYGEVVWQIPKFRFGSRFELKGTLKELGVTKAFDQNADFSGITDSTAFVTGLNQQTHIAIDENGVEASAFTEIGYCGAALPDGRAEMILDRPFIYGITANGTLLFVGICNNPAEK